MEKHKDIEMEFQRRELNRRLDEIDSGDTEGIPFQAAIQRMRARNSGTATPHCDCTPVNRILSLKEQVQIGLDQAERGQLLDGDVTMQELRDDLEERSR